MGTSFVKYQRFGFWTRDTILESWLKILADELEKLPVREPWLESLMDHWRIQAGVDGGVISAGLDEFLTDSKRRDEVLLVAKGALGRIGPTGHRTGELFIELLSGRLKTTSSSPIDYLSG